MVANHRRKVDAGPANWVLRLGFRFLPGVYDRLVGPLFGLLALGRAHVAPHDGNVFTATEDARMGTTKPGA